MSEEPKDLGAGGVPITAEGVLALGAVWEELAPPLKRFAKRITTNDEDLEDLVQEAMIALWAADLTRYDFRVPSDVAYLNRILVNEMCNAWKHRLRESETEGGDAAPGPQAQ